MRIARKLLRVGNDDDEFREESQDGTNGDSNSSGIAMGQGRIGNASVETTPVGGNELDILRSLQCRIAGRVPNRLGKQYIQDFPELAYDASTQFAQPHSDATPRKTLGRRGPDEIAISIHSNQGPDVRPKIPWNGNITKFLVVIIGVEISDDKHGGFLLSMHTLRKDGVNWSTSVIQRVASLFGFFVNVGREG